MGKLKNPSNMMPKEHQVMPQARKAHANDKKSSGEISRDEWLARQKG